MTKMFQFKISLNYSDPAIWRRVLVPVSFTFRKFHKVIQELFGWEEEHMHEFLVGKAYQSDKIEDSVSLENYFTRPKQKATYLYDFGDDWDHAIVFEKWQEDATEKHAVCIDGQLNAPPEDCGGMHGYYAMMETIQDKAHPEYESLQEWLGKFDPATLDMALVNKRLKRIK